VPQTPPPWYKNQILWLQALHVRQLLPGEAKALGKQIHNQNSFVPLHNYLQKKWPDFVAAGKLRAPSKPRTKSKSAKGDKKSSDKSGEEEEDEDEQEEPKSVSIEAKSSKASEPGKTRKPRARVPKERLQAMKAEADSKLKVLLEKLHEDVQGKEALQSLAEIVNNALRSVEDLSGESTPEPSQ
jgi:hypothetical protein